MAAGPSLTRAQSEEAVILDAIRTKKIPLTDEMIKSQKSRHPELRSKSDQEIRDYLEGKTSKPSDDSSASEMVVPAVPPAPKEQAVAQATTKSGERFPEGLKRFGYDFFINNPAAGTASANAPALPEYVLSPGDEIQIYTWGAENQNQTVIIDNEGMFHYPPLQPMRLAGLKFQAAQSLVTRELEKINGIKASVGLGRLKSIRVFVLGEAMNPGSYVVPAGATVTTALFQSGGISAIGSLRGIEIKRNGKVISSLDLYEMLLKGSNRSDIQLIPGDVIFVPVAPIQIAVTGMVKRPGIYEVKTKTKVLDVLDLAGGLSSNAFKGRVRLDRVENHRRKVVLDVGMEKMAGNANAMLQDGDILNVEEVLSREYDVVYLEGNVNRPGRYEYKKGMNIKDLVHGIQELKSETFFSYGHIKRSTEDNQKSLLLPFSLSDVFEKGVEVPLMPRDTVIIYSQFDIMDKPEVKIAGSLRRAGSFPFVDKMKISDLIIAGGGLSVEAYLPEAHLIRVLKIQESDSLYSTLLKVDLTHLIDNPGDPNNLELRPFDSLIIFPRRNFILPKSVTINGAVNRDGGYELTQNMGIPELVSQASGLKKNAYKLKIEVVRRVVVNDSVVRRDIHQLSLQDIMDGKVKFGLQDGDAVYLREVSDVGGSLMVHLGGEFNFPGRYEAAVGEKLSSVIRRAGGFTRNAYLRGAVFVRQSVRQRQLQTLGEIQQRLEIQSRNMLVQATEDKDRASIQNSIEQRRALLEEVRRAPNLGRVVIELDAKYKFEDTDRDLNLENGDDLWVGSYPNIVSIMGEVYSPTNVVYGSANNSVAECLNKAGGVAEFGDENNIYYLRPDGSVITPRNTFFFGWAGVEPGGVIIVPPKGPKSSYLDDLTKITQIIYQIAISVGVAKTVFSP